MFWIVVLLEDKSPSQSQVFWTQCAQSGLSVHSLAIETGRQRQTWLPREDRLCSFCSGGEVETELHFLLHCDKYPDLREYFFPKIIIQYKEFETIKDEEKIKYLLGEEPKCAVLAAKYVSSFTT